jgi:citrate lyase subunit beta/citryl-CoA lyase
MPRREPQAFAKGILESIREVENGLPRRRASFPGAANPVRSLGTVEISNRFGLVRAPATQQDGLMQLRRSLLFVPGEARKIEKAKTTGADTLLFDLEDSIAPEKKDAARREVAAALREGGFGEVEAAVRVNAHGSPFFRADIEAVVAAGAHAIMVPKADGREIARVGEALDALERSLEIFGNRREKILALVETAAGIAHAAALGGSPRVDALCFGHADFSLDMGLAEADAAQGIVYHARCQLVIAAKACGVAPIDSVFLAVKDDAAFRADAEIGMRLGFEGKLCIHPRQVAIANEVYTPSREQIDRARQVVDAWEKAKGDGQGVFTFEGKMIDAPLAAVQERVLERARRAGAI